MIMNLQEGDRKNFFLITIMVLLIIMLFILAHGPLPHVIDRELDYSWAIENRLIAHALGGYKGKTYTNSLEAFHYNYQQGYRVFEIDLLFSKDNEVVAFHDINADDFTCTELRAMYTERGWELINLSKLRKIMTRYPDTYFVIDTKENDLKRIGALYLALVDEMESCDCGLLNRIIPQLYSPKMLIALERIYPFSSYILTLYRTRLSDQDVIDFVKLNGIKVVTMSEQRYNYQFVIKLNQNRIKSYLHTINDRVVALKYLKQGVFGFYTDILNKKELRE